MRASIAVLPALVLVSSIALAQKFPPLGTRLGPEFKESDLAIVGKASGALNEAGKGARHWSNPATGSTGTVAVLHGFRSAGMACHAMHYVFHLTHPARQRTYTLDWCRTPEGAWKIKG